MKGTNKVVLIFVLGLGAIFGFAMWGLVSSRTLSNFETNSMGTVDTDVALREDNIELPKFLEVERQSAPGFEDIENLRQLRYEVVENYDTDGREHFVRVMQQVLWYETLQSYSVGDFEQQVSTIYCDNGIVNVVFMYFMEQGDVFLQLIQEGQVLRVDHIPVSSKPITCDYLEGKGFLVGCIDPDYESFAASTQAYYLKYTDIGVTTDIIDTSGLLFTVIDNNVWAIDKHHNKYVLDVDSSPLIFMPSND